MSIQTPADSKGEQTWWDGLDCDERGVDDELGYDVIPQKECA